MRCYLLRLTSYGMRIRELYFGDPGIVLSVLTLTEEYLVILSRKAMVTCDKYIA